MGVRVRRLVPLVCAAPALHAAAFYLTVAGLGGEPDYEKQFSGEAAAIEKTVRAADAAAHIVTLHGADAARAHVQAALARIATEAGAGDTLVVMLIGHGSFDGLEYKMNVPGPDITATDLAAWIDRVPARRQLMVNMTSSSGASMQALEKPGRIVITATKSGNEKNVTVFARYWADALSDPGANTDKNGALSALEAFRYAEDRTARFYETEKRLATEHPQLQDAGRGEGTAHPSPANGQGLLAAQFVLLPLGESAATASSPARAALLRHKQEVEDQIDQLKYRKAALPEDEYRRRLTALLVDLAKTQAEIDK